MGYVTANANWATITIDTSKGTIFVQEKWKYSWFTAPRITAWTRTEKTNFHTKADKNMWHAWSNKLSLQVKGTSSFALKQKKRSVKVNFDIKKVTAGQHWVVKVTKIAVNGFKRSNVNWTGRVINLDTNDFDDKSHCRAVPRGQSGPTFCTTQKPIRHEIGHTVGNTVVLGRGDEYRRGHANRGDQASMMNVGEKLRKRHFRTLIEELNKMIPGTTFSVKHIR